jgi:hypothetical protein
MTDEVTPHFEKRRDEGELICNYMSQSKGTFAGFDGKVRVYKQAKRLSDGRITNYTHVTTYAKHWWAPTGGTLGQPAPYWCDTQVSRAWNDVVWEGAPGAPDGDAVRQAMTAVSAELASGIADVITTLAEAGKTWQMIAKAIRFLRMPVKDAMRNLGYTIQDIWRVDRKRKQVWLEASRLWMEARYGWRPFIFDVMNIWDAAVVSKASNRRKETGDVEGYPWSASRDVRVTGCSTYTTGLTVDWYAKIRGVASARVGQNADFRAGINSTARVFGLVSPVTTAWELIPFSWVVDKFLNLGDCAQALQAYALCDERIGWLTLRNEATCHYYVTVPSPGPVVISGSEYTITGTSPAPGVEFGKETVVYYERTPITDFVPMIGQSDDLKLSEIVDLLALLRVLLHGAASRQHAANTYRD